MIVVKTCDGNEHRFREGRKYNFRHFRKFLYIYDWRQETIAVFTLSSVTGWWEE